MRHGSVTSRRGRAAPDAKHRQPAGRVTGTAAGQAPVHPRPQAPDPHPRGRDLCRVRHPGAGRDPARQHGADRQSGRGVLSLSVLPTFATRWLAPRIGQFLSDNPGISINLSTKIQRFSFASEAFDAVIFFGQPDWPDAHHLRLFDERPDGLRLAADAGASSGGASLGHGGPAPAAAGDAAFGLVRVVRGPGRHAAGCVGHGDGPVLDDDPGGNRGLGVALLPSYLAQPEIDEGRLQPILRAGVPGEGPIGWLGRPSRQVTRPLHGFAPGSRIRFTAG